MSAPELKPGDLVRLKSGGPLMTVSSVDENASTPIGVVWFSRDNDAEQCWAQFRPVCLVLVPNEGAP